MILCRIIGVVIRITATTPANNALTLVISPIEAISRPTQINRAVHSALSRRVDFDAIELYTIARRIWVIRGTAIITPAPGAGVPDLHDLTVIVVERLGSRPHRDFHVERRMKREGATRAVRPYVHEIIWVVPA
jgi:hypothetical protein